MTVQTLLRVTTCPIELRSGGRSIFAKIREERISKHLGEEVIEIKARCKKLIVFSEVPSYELDRDVDVDQTEYDLPWD